MSLHDDHLNSHFGVQSIAWAFSFCFSCLVVGSLPELNRWTGAILLLAPAYGSLQTSPKLSPNDFFNDTYSRFVIIMFSHMIALCFMPNGKSSATKDDVSNRDTSLKMGWKRAYNARGIGLAWENLNLWPKHRTTLAFTRPPKNTFKDKSTKALVSHHSLATRSKWIAVSIRLGYLLLNSILLSLFFQHRVSATVGQFTLADMDPEKEGILRRTLQHHFFLNATPASPITIRELKIRALLTINKFTPDVLFLSAFHDFLAILFIASGIDESWEWPPLFGPITEAYTMRRFWASFWHRLVYKSFSFHASMFTEMLGIPQGTSLSRILNNCLVFVLSAIMHATVSTLYGRRCAWGRGTIIFWCIQPFSFVIEGFVQYFWRRIRKSSLVWMTPSSLSVFERGVGYVWVIGWLMWAAPKADFAFQNCSA